MTMQWMTFVGPSFLMDVPTDWLLISQPQFQVMFLSPRLEGDGRRVNLTVSVRAIEGEMAEVVETMVKQMAEAYTAYELREMGDFSTASGADGLRHDYAWRRVDEDVPVVQRQVFFGDGDLLVTLTGSRPGDLGEEMAELVDGMFTRMFESVRFEEMVLGTG
jgi:hypothetical protein